jgi:hypothetical protein
VFELRLAMVKCKARGLERWNIGALVGAIGDLEDQVDDRLGGEVGDLGRAGMMEADHPRPQRGAHLFG